MTVTVRWGDGEEQTRELDLVAGKVATAEFDLAPPKTDSADPSGSPDSRERPAESEGDFPAPPLASWIAAGVGVVGFGMFAIFGSLSASTAGDLDECAPACPAGLREDADTGQTYQIVANVGLVVGVTGIAAAGTIWLIDGLMDEDAEPADDTADGPDVALSLGPGSVLVHGRF